jgi:hypothetical protein
MVNGTFTAFKMWNFLPGDGGKTAFLAAASDGHNQPNTLTEFHF